MSAAANPLSFSECSRYRLLEWVENHVELRPGVADSGIRFIREDLDGACVPVSLHNRIDAEKRTNLQVGEARIEMVEHVLSTCSDGY